MANHSQHPLTDDREVVEDFDPFDIIGGGGGGGGGQHHNHPSNGINRQEHRRHRHHTPPPPKNHRLRSSSSNPNTTGTTPSSTTKSFDDGGRGGGGGSIRKSRSLTPPPRHRRQGQGQHRHGSSTAGNSMNTTSPFLWNNLNLKNSPFLVGSSRSKNNNNNSKSSGTFGTGTTRSTTNLGGATTTTPTATTTPAPSKSKSKTTLSSYVGIGTACLLPEELKFPISSSSGGQQRKLLQDYDYDEVAGGATTTGLTAELVCDMKEGQMMFVSGISLDPYLLDENDDDVGEESLLSVDRQGNNNKFGPGGGGGEAVGLGYCQQQTQEELGFEVSFSDLLNNNSSSTRTFSPRMVLATSPFTDAVKPFQNCLPISSGYLHDELLQHDYAFIHATQSCGQCWQSIVSQHVRMPTVWWWTNSTNTNTSASEEAFFEEGYDFDHHHHHHHHAQQQEYGRPPLGSSEPFDCPWVYMVNNTIRGHPLLIRHVIPNARSPGVILLHLVVRSYKTVGESSGHHRGHRRHHHHQQHNNPVVICDLEDVVVGCYHPVHHRTSLRNSGGRDDYDHDDVVDENIRHVWISHRSRRSTTSSTTSKYQGNPDSSLLYMYLHQHRTMKDDNMYTNPFLIHSNSHHDPKHHRMNTNDQQARNNSNYNNNNNNRNHDRAINNDNLRYIFGDRPPLSTVMVSEQDVLNVFAEGQRRHVPPSVMLLEKYLWSPPNNK